MRLKWCPRIRAQLKSRNTPVRVDQLPLWPGNILEPYPENNLNDWKSYIEQNLKHSSTTQTYLITWLKGSHTNADMITHYLKKCFCHWCACDLVYRSLYPIIWIYNKTWNYVYRICSLPLLFQCYYRNICEVYFFGFGGNSGVSFKRAEFSVSS